MVHHLENSRSQRVLWLLEELSLPYQVIRYERAKKTMLAPPELRAIHPLGKSPVIVDDLGTVKPGLSPRPERSSSIWSPRRTVGSARPPTQRARMAEADVPMQKISQYLGHASTAITEKVYARYSPSFMKDAADALDW